MSVVPASSVRLGRLFHLAFRVTDIAQPLVSFDDTTPAPLAARFALAHGLDVVGVRCGGIVTGYLLAADLSDGERATCGEKARPFAPGAIVSDDLPLADGLRRLDERDHLFVAMLGQVAGVLSLRDVQKPPVRMWLFGLITLLEMGLAGAIDAHFPDGAWHGMISAGRLQKARELLAERRRGGVGANLTLLDCLQLTDKGQILMRDEATRTLLRIGSRSDGDKRFRRLARLRDNLAHAQDIVSEDWTMILDLAGQVEGILALGERFARTTTTASWTRS